MFLFKISSYMKIVLDEHAVVGVYSRVPGSRSAEFSSRSSAGEPNRGELDSSRKPGHFSARL